MAEKRFFGAGVRTLYVKDSAALGAAIRVAHAWCNRHGPSVTWPDICRTVVKARMGRVVCPSASAVAATKTRAASSVSTRPASASAAGGTRSR